ncbi:hypothetical protein TRFO_19120 [Tritrichomonas foetus]|uniref:Uncharacterized protein n=1 Tax=Tritrichomonas foetus TaxID=1144522 RepID=A0A1J4KJH9_9EUKA|nr:hypothetical protein TRFO_19120 [Tritrichomonas foetus]|eukprot:OHT11473.1 hypothetical protein TRFO_19120 [Tritrichomonas foetus]
MFFGIVFCLALLNELSNSSTNNPPYTIEEITDTPKIGDETKPILTSAVETDFPTKLPTENPPTPIPPTENPPTENPPTTQPTTPIPPTENPPTQQPQTTQPPTEAPTSPTATPLPPTPTTTDDRSPTQFETDTTPVTEQPSPTFNKKNNFSLIIALTVAAVTMVVGLIILGICYRNHRRRFELSESMMTPIVRTELID